MVSEVRRELGKRCGWLLGLLLVLGAVEAATRAVPFDPAHPIVLTLVVITSLYGMSRGLLALAVAAAYAAYAYAVPGSPFHYSAGSRKDLLLFLFAAPASVLTIGILKRRYDQLRTSESARRGPGGDALQRVRRKHQRGLLRLQGGHERMPLHQPVL